jgi:hypothetical protein
VPVALFAFHLEQRLQISDMSLIFFHCLFGEGDETGRWWNRLASGVADGGVRGAL